MKNNLKYRTISGLKWNVTNRMFTQGLSVLVTIVLARLLSPEEFGLIAMVSVFTGFVVIWVDFGLSSAVIQSRHADTSHWSSVFWLNLLSSFLLALGLSLFAPVVARFYEEPQLEAITIAIAWSMFVQAIGMVQISLLRKALRFKELALVNIIAQSIAGLVAIYFAYVGYAYWSLIIKLYIALILTSCGVWLVSDWRPKLVFKWRNLKSLTDFSLPLAGTQALNYWTRNADNLMVGKILGDVALGVYSRAYALMLAPLQNVSRVLSSVLFPALSAIQEDKASIRQVYLQSSRIIAMITFPLMFCFSAIAEPLILIVLGPKWLEVVPIIKILAPLGAIQSVGTLNGNVFLARGATKLQFKVGTPLRILQIGIMWLGLYLGGLIGLAWAYLSASCLIGLIMFHYMGKTIDLSLQAIIKNMRMIFFCAVLVAFGVGMLYSWIDSYLSSHWLKVLIVTLISIIVYLSLIIKWMPKADWQLLQAFMSKSLDRSS